MRLKKKIKLEEYKPVKVTSADIGKEQLLKKQINRAAKAIQKKYLALKMGRADEDETLNRLLNPIIEPLKDIKIQVPINNVIKQDNGKTESIKKHHIKTKQPVTFLQDEVIGEVFSDKEPEEEEPTAEQTIDDIQEEYNNLLRYDKPVIDQFLEQFPPLSRYYIDGFFTNRENYDENFGARFDFQTNRLFIGNKEIHIGDNNELIVDNRPYQGTKGLYELVFLKKPHGFTKSDLKHYKEILEYSSAHRRNYEPEGQIKGNRHSKYTSIIKPLFRTQSQSNIPSPTTVGTSARRRVSYSTTPREGSGMMMVNNDKPIEYVYWDDVNEIVDRLRLLMASKSAGNTLSLNNEIISIISELKEIGVIS